MKAIALLLLFIFAVTLHAQENLPFINELPKMRTDALQKSKPLWESGDPAKIQEGNLLYKNALLDMIQKLAETSYPKDHFGKQGIKAHFEKVCNSLTELYALLNDNKNVPDETMKKVATASDINLFLENTLRDLVLRVTVGQKNFDIQKWNQQWDGISQAPKTKKMQSL